ncbi:MAG: acetyltransferase [Bacteroidales bacterium]|nr:acetyltransferase [Bacteroidales bacterium]
MKNKPEIILIGGGGHCKAVIDVIETENKFKIAGIIDLPDKLGQSILDYKIIGADNDIPQLAKQFNCFFITVGHIQTPVLRIKLFNLVKKSGGELPVIISPNAHVSKHAKIGEGTIIMHNTVINADSEIGNNCIINNKALIEHDCRIGNNCHISTSAVVNGGLLIGDNCFIGSNSVSKQYIKIVNETNIGAGAVVTKSITESGVYVGNPAKRIK